MDMTDLNRAPASAKAASEQKMTSADRPWQDAVSALSSEVAVPLTAALERVETMMSTGRIDRTGLHALHEDLLQAKQLSVSGQQLTRLASGQIRQTPERLQLGDTLRQVLEQRAGDIRRRGVAIQLELRSKEVVVDASLLFNLVDALVRWGAEHALASLHFCIDTKPWPSIARLSCRFTHTRHDALLNDVMTPPTAAPLNTLGWRLVEQTAKAMGLDVERQDEQGTVQVRFEFPRTVHEPLEGLSTIDLGEGFSPGVNAKPFAGNQVLVVASRREVRVQIRDAIRNMGLVVDFAASVEEAREFCMGGLPQAVVIESVLRGDRFNHFRREVEASDAKVVFLEILEEGSAFEISGANGLNSMARVGRDAIAQSLPSALVFELSKSA